MRKFTGIYIYTGVIIIIASLLGTSLSVLNVLKSSGILDSQEYRQIIIIAVVGLSVTTLIGLYIILRTVDYVRRIEVFTDTLQNRTLELLEQAAGQSCLLEINRLAETEGENIDRFLQQCVRVLPAVFRYAQDASARITYQNKEFSYRHFWKTEWTLTADIISKNKKIGALEVCYNEKKENADIGPFTAGELEFLRASADKISRVIENAGRKSKDSESLSALSRAQTVSDESILKLQKLFHRREISNRTGGKTKVLLALNESHHRKLIEELMKQIGGIFLLTTQSGKEALALAEREKTSLSLIISDLFLPDLNGIQLLKTTGYDNQKLSYIFLTDYPPDFVFNVCNLDDRVRVTTKPLEIKKICAALETLY